MPLLEAKAHVECRDRSHQTPLHLAVTRGHARTIHLLITARGSVSARDEVRAALSASLIALDCG